MDVLELSAVRFIQPMKVGRTGALLLGCEPKQSATRKAFDHARHLLQKIPGQTKLVRENELEEFTDKVAAEIAQHDRQ
jgi:hypothetical protein